MLKSESYLFEILQKYSKFGEWKFFEILDNGGKSLPQTKNYGNGFISYPDFEFYSDKKLMLLVEVKGMENYLGLKEFDIDKELNDMRIDNE